MRSALQNPGFVKGLILLLLCFALTTRVGADSAVGYRIGLTPVILTDQTSFLKDWQSYLTTHLGEPVKFVQRQTYKEITELLLAGQLDAAWLCGYPYVVHRGELKLLSVPIFRGSPKYHSYLIVPAADIKSRGLLDLKEKVFVYSDPDSNSGYLYPQVELIKAGIEPRYFFSKTFFAWSHRGVVTAVADGLARGGAVDSYVWETLAEKEPNLASRTRIVSKSPEYGFPPLVIPRGLERRRAGKLQQALLDMSSDPVGAELLHRLNLGGFIVGSDELYDGIAESIRILESGK